jgi:hypothetical protein
VDGVPVPNTNIASKLGPQVDPKDIDYMEVNRGSYCAEFGDRTYGVFNIVPRTGFERNNEAELFLAAICDSPNSVPKVAFEFEDAGLDLNTRDEALWHRLVPAKRCLAYSNQIAEGALPITGGLTNFSPSTPLFLLDHDQRNTLNVGGNLALPWRSYASTNVYYGSGFSNAFPGQPYPGDHLPQHTTFDLALGKDFGERFSVSLHALNVANRRVELDNSQTFGGFHWNNPREIYAEFRYRFHY